MKELLDLEAQALLATDSGKDTDFEPLFRRFLEALRSLVEAKSAQCGMDTVVAAIDKQLGENKPELAAA